MENNFLRFKPPKLPKNVATFSCTDFGNYGPRGYNPIAIAGRISGIPIKYFEEGEWLLTKDTGLSGSMFVFYDKKGVELGRCHKPSAGVLAWHGRDMSQLNFIPTQVSALPITGVGIMV